MTKKLWLPVIKNCDDCNRKVMLNDGEGNYKCLSNHTVKHEAKNDKQN